MFKIGDQFTVDQRSGYENRFNEDEVGTIIHIDKGVGQPYLLVFPHRKDLHDGNGTNHYPHSERTNLWWFRKEDLIPYNPIPLQYEDMM